MRRFIITSPGRFKGKVEAHYKLNEQLCKIDFTQCELTSEGIAWIKRNIPVLIENMPQLEAAGIQVEETEFEVTFQDFKREYPYTRNAHLAEKFWPTMTSAKQYHAFISAMDYREYAKKNESWYKPMMADKWLKTEQYKNNWKEL